jgi:hypothetical protein
VKSSELTREKEAHA